MYLVVLVTIKLHAEVISEQEKESRITSPLVPIMPPPRSMSAVLIMHVCVWVGRSLV